MPFFLAPFAAWLMSKFAGTAAERAFKIAAAAYYLAIYAACVLALAAISTVVSVPPVMAQVLSVLAPSSWADQLAVVVSARATSVAMNVFSAAYKKATE